MKALPVLALLATLAATVASEKCRVIRETMLSCIEADEKDLPKAINQKVTWFTLSKSKVPRIQKSMLKIYPKLTDFHAEKAEIERVDADAFKGLVGLSWVDLSQNKISEIDPDIFSDAVTVDHFNISGNVNLAIPKNKPLLKAKTLKWLDISSCSIRELYPQTFEELTSLRDLSLAHNLLKTLPDNIFKNNRGLLSIDITDNKIKTLSAAVFANMRTMVLRFEDNPWNCDCHLSPLIMFSKRNVLKGDVKCDKPNNKKWKDIANPQICAA